MILTASGVGFPMRQTCTVNPLQQIHQTTISAALFSEIYYLDTKAPLENKCRVNVAGVAIQLGYYYSLVQLIKLVAAQNAISTANNEC